MRSVAALSRAEDLQGELDKLAVEQTLRGVSGGVSASTLIDHFAGTLVRQSHRVEVRNLCRGQRVNIPAMSTQQKDYCLMFLGIFFRGGFSRHR